jgi:hypothetical protein
MRNFENDELDSITTRKTETSHTAPTTNNLRASADDLDSLAITFGDKDLMKREGLDLCRADQDRRVRFNLFRAMRTLALSIRKELGFILSARGSRGPRTVALQRRTIGPCVPLAQRVLSVH